MSKKVMLLILFPLSVLLGVFAEKPNVLFIAIDDFKPLLGAYGESWVQTPEIDALAQNGAVFTANYCQVSICAPTRFSLLTGLRPDATGVYSNPAMAEDILRSRLPLVVTLPQQFKKNGYLSCGMGKVYDGRTVDDGMDTASWSVPYVKNLDVAEGGLGVQGYQNPETQSYIREKKKSTQQVWGPPVECFDVPDNAYLDGAMGLTGAEKIRELSASGTPFFLAVGFLKPHLPFIAPKRYWDLYDRSVLPLAPFQSLPENCPHDLSFFGNSGELRSYAYDGEWVPPLDEAHQRELIHGYAACASFIDAQVGLLMNALRETGQLDNTIICLWGDHGWHLGEHGYWGKLTDYEDAARAPLIISAPGIDARRVGALTEFLDVYPTLCDLAGIPIPEHAQGRSLVPLLTGDADSIHEAAITQMVKGGPVSRMGWAIRTPRYRYIEWRKAEDLECDEPVFGEIITGELYDYERDPMERKNLAGDPEYAEILSEHKALFAELFPIISIRNRSFEISSGDVPAKNIFSQDFETSDNVSDYRSKDPGATLFTDISSAPGTDLFSIDDGVLQVQKKGGVSVIGRVRLFSTTPLKMFSLQLDVDFGKITKPSGALLSYIQMFDRTLARTWGDFGIEVDRAGDTWRIAGGKGRFSGMQTIRIIVNNSGDDHVYMTPLGDPKLLSNTVVDIWVGETLARSSIPSHLDTDHAITSFRIVLPPADEMIIRFDNFLVETF